MVFWQHLKQDKLAILCLTIIAGVLLLGVLAPVIAPHDPLKLNVAEKYAAVSPEYPFGTDQLGRCVLSRLLYGIRATVGLSLVTMVATLGIGTLLGVIAGFFRGRIDEAIMRLCDVVLSFPS